MNLVPKPMIPVLGRPVMEYLVDLLRSHGVREIVVNTSYRAPQIEEYFRDGSRFGVEMAYSFEGELAEDGTLVDAPVGSAGGLARVEDHSGFFDSTFVVVCGDAIVDLDLGAVVAAHRRSGGARHHRVQAGRALRGVLVRHRGGRRCRPRHVLPGEAATRGGPERPRQHRHLRVRARRLRPHPEGRSLRHRLAALPGPRRGGCAPPRGGGVLSLDRHRKRPAASDLRWAVDDARRLATRGLPSPLA